MLCAGRDGRGLVPGASLRGQDFVYVTFTTVGGTSWQMPVGCGARCSVFPLMQTDRCQHNVTHSLHCQCQPLGLYAELTIPQLLMRHVRATRLPLHDDIDMLHGTVHVTSLTKRCCCTYTLVNGSLCALACGRAYTSPRLIAALSISDARMPKAEGHSITQSCQLLGTVPCTGCNRAAEDPQVAYNESCMHGAHRLRHSWSQHLYV